MNETRLSYYGNGWGNSNYEDSAAARSGNDENRSADGRRTESLKASSSQAHRWNGRSNSHDDDNGSGGHRQQSEFYNLHSHPEEQRSLSMQQAGSNSSKVGQDGFGSRPAMASDVNVSQSQKGLRRILNRFAEKCSMQGPPYIVASTRWFSRALWIFLFFAAMGLMGYHLYHLCQTYFDYPVKNTIKLGFASLQFPAITVCNVNPVRASRQNLLSDDFNRLVGLLDPTKLGDQIEAMQDGVIIDTDDVDDDEHQLDHMDFGLDNFTLTDGRDDLSDEDFSDLEGFDSSWESEGKASTFSQLEQMFTDVYSTERRAARIAAGHKIKTMLVGCSFSGKACTAKNFTLHTSAKHGNCYTLQYDKFLSRQSGPEGGLELLFYVERDEYLPGFTHSDGLQVVIHPQMTSVVPHHDGAAVAAGTHTKMALRLININRKGDPYGICVPSDAYWDLYGLSYTRQMCHRFCQQRQVHQQCQCHDETAEDVNIRMNLTTLKPCRKRTEMKCLNRVRWEFNGGNEACNCHNPCIEQEYAKMVSYRPWPSEEYARGVLVPAVCRKVSTQRCTKLKDSPGYNLSRNFVKLDIYFEDLNYENITEEPDYEDVQFISDVGGTLGLWVGLSALGFLEVIQLAVELFRFAFCRCCKAK